jgi:hypothetical protein
MRGIASVCAFMSKARTSKVPKSKSKFFINVAYGIVEK